MKSKFQKTTAILLTLSLVAGVFGNLPTLAQTTADAAKTTSSNYNKTHVMVLTGAGTKDEDGNFRVVLQKDGSYKLETYYGAHRRYGHTATKLQDGRVLITGGTNGEHALQGANYFDPKTGDIEFVSDMRYPRVWHTATLLPDGNVLILGGRTWSGPDTTLKEVERKTALVDKFVQWFYQLTNRWEPENEGGDPLNTGEVFLAKQNKFVTLYEYFDLTRVKGYSYLGRYNADLEPKMLNYRSGQTATYLPITNQVLIVGGALNDPATNPLPQDDRLEGAGAVPQNIEFNASLSTDYLGPDGTGTIVVSLVHKILPLDPFATATIHVRVVGDARLIRPAGKGEFSEDYTIDLHEVTAKIKPQYKPNTYQVGIIGDYRRSEKLAVAIEVTAKYQGAEFGKVLYAKRTKSTESTDSVTSAPSSSKTNDRTFSDVTNQSDNSDGKNQPVEKAFSYYRSNEEAGGELLDLNTGKFVSLQENIPNSFSHSALALNDGKVLLAGGDFTTATIYDSTTYTFSPVAPLTLFRDNIALLPIKDATKRTRQVILFGGDGISGKSPTSAQVKSYCDYWYPSPKGPIKGTITKTVDKIIGRPGGYCTSPYWPINPQVVESKLHRDNLAVFDVFDVAAQTITHLSTPSYVGTEADHTESATDQGGNWLYKLWSAGKKQLSRIFKWLELQSAFEKGVTNRSVAVIKNNQFLLAGPQGSAVYDFDANTVELLDSLAYMMPISYINKGEGSTSVKSGQSWLGSAGRILKISPYAEITAIAEGKILITGGRLQATKYPTQINQSFAGVSFTQTQVDELKKIAESMADITGKTAFLAGSPLLGAFHAAGFLGPTIITHALLMIAGLNIQWEGLLNDDFPKDSWFTSVASMDAWLFEPNPVAAKTSETNALSPLPPVSDESLEVETPRTGATVCTHTTSGGTLCTNDGYKTFYWEYWYDTDGDGAYDLRKTSPFAGTAEDGAKVMRGY